MKTIVKELILDIHDSIFASSILEIQLFAFSLLCLFAFQFSEDVNSLQSGMVYAHQEKELYRLVDNLVGQYETEFFQNSDSLARLGIMYSKLKNAEQFEYLEMYDNPIVFVSDTVPDEVLYTYEEGGGPDHRGIVDGEMFSEIKCFWMSRNVADLFELKCDTGDFWEEEDKNNSPIPIVLGSQYRATFTVGDVTDGFTPVSPRGKFEVTGILKEGEYLVYNGQVLCLDRYVLMPMQDGNAVTLTSEERTRQRLLYLFKINGALYSDLSANELQTFIQNICETSGVLPASTVAGATNQQSQLVEMNLQDAVQILQKMVMLLYAFSIVSTILFFIIKVDDNSRYYSILILNGFSFRQIMSIILGSLLLLLLLPEALAMLICSVIGLFVQGGWTLSLKLIAVHNISLVGTVGVISYYKLRRLNIQSHIGGFE